MSARLTRRRRSGRIVAGSEISHLHQSIKAVVEPLERRFLLAAATWDGGPTGNGTNFLDPVNWVGDALPNPGDIATIGATGSNPTISIAGTVTSLSINSSRQLEF